MSQAKSIPLGPVVIDVAGTELGPDDYRRLALSMDLGGERL